MFWVTKNAHQINRFVTLIMWLSIDGQMFLFQLKLKILISNHAGEHLCRLTTAVIWANSLFTHEFEQVFSLVASDISDNT